MRRGKPALTGLAAALAAFGVFETWNHRTGLLPLAAGALAPGVLPGPAKTMSGPLLLGLAGFSLPRGGHHAQVAALGWSARLFLERGRAVI